MRAPEPVAAAEANFSIGVDVGGTSTRVVAFGADDEVLHVRTSATPSGAAALLSHLGSEVGAVRRTVERPLAAIGVGIPGGVRAGVVTLALNIGIDAPIDVAAALSDHFDVPVRVENDVNAAAYGAAARSSLADRGGLTFLSIGTGLAAGTVLDGALVRGAIGMAGEIGHVTIPGRRELCPCGQRGCIETLASGRALVSRLRDVGLAGDVHTLWAAADAGHGGAVEIRDDAVDAVAWCCRLAVMLLDVDRVVIGGGVGLALGARLVDDVRSALERERSPLIDAFGLERRVVTAPVGVELGALGAARLARRSDHVS